MLADPAANEYSFNGFRLRRGWDRGRQRTFERTLSQPAWDGRTRPKPVVAVITGCASAYLSWPGGVKLYDPSHAQVAAHVTFTFAWKPLNRPVPPVNVRMPRPVLRSSTTWP